MPETGPEFGASQVHSGRGRHRYPRLVAGQVEFSRGTPLRGGGGERGHTASITSRVETRAARVFEIHSARGEQPIEGLLIKGPRASIDDDAFGGLCRHDASHSCSEWGRTSAITTTDRVAEKGGWFLRKDAGQVKNLTR